MSDWGNAVTTANIALAIVVGSIREMGLEAPQKTEAIFVYDKVMGASSPAEIKVRTTTMRVGSYMKYLGLTIDGLWESRTHFELLTPRLTPSRVSCRTCTARSDG